MVVNRHQSGDVLPVKDAEDLLQAPIYWKLPNEYKLSAESLTQGVPVVLHDPGSRLAKSYADLARKLSGTAGGSTIARHSTPSGSSRLRKLFGTERGARNVS